MEVSVGNWERDGHWILVHYFASNTILGFDGRPVGPVNIDKQTVQIRGYTVPYTIPSNNKKINASVQVCGGPVRDSLQIRWLQSARLFNDAIKDLISLERISIRLLQCSQENIFINENR